MNILPLTVTPTIRGFVKRIEAIHAETGRRRILLKDGCPNTILLTGLAVMDLRSDWMNWCQVGTNNTAPSTLQTSLQGWVAGTNNLGLLGTTTGAQISPPYYGWKQKVFRFDPLTGSNEILNEVGVGWNDGDVGNEDTLISRALIVDINGDRISPTWVVGEYLDVTYELRYYPPLVDVTGTHAFDGITYNYILRAAAVTSTLYWASNIGSAMGQYSSTVADWRASDGNIGTIVDDGPPIGLFANCDNSTQFNVIVAPQYTIGVASTCSSAGWNLADPGDGGGPGIRSLRFRTSAGSYQIQFGEGVGATGLRIPKTALFTMAIQYNLTWAEGTIP